MDAPVYSLELRKRTDYMCRQVLKDTKGYDRYTEEFVSDDENAVEMMLDSLMTA